MKKQYPFKINIITSLLLATLFIVEQANAENNQSITDVQLNDVHIKGSATKKITRKTHDVTGLGKIIKDSNRLNKEQILGIRDLIRYDPGISITEQGKGATAGYSIRGVDKNRVALSVDNLPQIQSHIMFTDLSRTSSASSGAINDIEYENIRTVELSKGASSASYGSGALGGAVSFMTKEPNDIIKEGKSWGLQNKTAYSSKNSQHTQSLAFAGKTDQFEAMAIYTHKTGREFKAHKDIERNYQVKTLGAYTNKYDLTRELDAKSEAWFLTKNDCPSLDPTVCTPSPRAESTRYSPLTKRVNPPYSSEEEKQYNAMNNPKIENFNAQNYTGPLRALPNPMEYKTDSWLIKSGYHLSPKHYIGGVFEHSTQHYDIRDMLLEQYWNHKTEVSSRNPFGLYTHSQNPIDSIFIPKNTQGGILGQGLKYSRTRYLEEKHIKDRKGIVYKYQAAKGDNSFIDNLSFALDRQKISINSQEYFRNCEIYPNVDKNCRASLDKLWSYFSSNKNKYTEKHDLIRLDLDKTLKFKDTIHNISFASGMDNALSVSQRLNFSEEGTVEKWSLATSAKASTPYVNGKGTYDNPYLYEKGKREIIQNEYCGYSDSDRHKSDCRPRRIRLHNYFIGLRDNIAFGKYLDLGIGARYDYIGIRSQDPWVSTKTYKNLSWDSGFVLKPTKHIALSYKYSSGFRAPNFQEAYGLRLENSHYTELGRQTQYISNLNVEKSSNQEIGIALKGDLGFFEISYFKNKYTDLITKGKISAQTDSYGFHNIQNIKLKGINILAKLDMNGLTDYAPEGLYATFAYNKIKPISVFNKPGYDYAESPFLDAIQPARYIIGFGYDNPNELWGINASMTHSKGKSKDELIGTSGPLDKLSTSTKKSTKSWHIFDLVGYINIKKTLTLRAGVYNLMNYRYTTWESVRQSGITALNRPRDVADYARYVAPGRNYTLNLELKF